MDVEVIVKLKDLPRFSDLGEKVRGIVDKSSWVERYGLEWYAFSVSLAFVPAGFLLLRSDSFFQLALGMIILGTVHTIFANRLGHLATHGGMCESPRINKFLSIFFVEFVGAFSEHLGYDAHVKIHHPHTNIIGLGDSSIWKAPMLPVNVYMFLAPLLLPVITPIVTFLEMVRLRLWRHLPRAVLTILSGLAAHVYIMTQVCGFNVMTSLLCIFAYRAVWTIPYIHMNIFQHIGLPMYSPKARPVRVYQMSTGVLNLAPHPIFDVIFGPALYNCHVEHHLFPKLSDSMCVKIKPIVSQFLQESGLEYKEDTYYNRLQLFLKRYDEFMVKAPPITHFVGLQ